MNAGTLKCCGVNRVQLIVNGVDPVMVKELDMEGKLLDFDLLSRMDAIKSLNGFRINRTGEVCSTSSDVPAVVALNIDEIDFSIDFDRHKYVNIMEVDTRSIGRLLKGKEYPSISFLEEEKRLKVYAIVLDNG